MFEASIPLDAHWLSTACIVILEHMTKTNAHAFDTALHLEGGPDRWHGQTSPAYANMIGPFGGITAAALLKPLLLHPQRLGEPITLTVNFAAAVKSGPFEISTQLMRTNRSTQHWFVTMAQEDGVVATATAVFALRREAWGDTELAFPGTPANPIAVDNGAMPQWARQYLFEIDGGIERVFSSGNQTSETLQTIRDAPPRALDFLSLAAMSDVFFPRIFTRIGRFAPDGTVSFTVYFHADSTALATIGDAAVIGQARANRFYNRYFDQSAEIWSQDGVLLATSTQIVYYKA